VVWVSIVSQIKRAVQITVPHIKKFLAAFFPIRNLLSYHLRINLMGYKIKIALIKAKIIDLSQNPSF
jgi:hypothetical protein